MRIRTAARLVGIALGLLVAPCLSAQTLDEICPGADEGTGALWGAVLDTDGEMVLPGATVIASWSADGQDRSAEVRTALDGAYRMCHLPLDATVWVHASFGAAAGEAVAVPITDVFTRQDLSLSMSGAGAGGERIWLCVDGGHSVFNLQFSRLFRCDDGWQPLERCPKTELGQITVQPVGAGSGMLREMSEQIVLEARRLGANAVINLRDTRAGTSFIGTQHMGTLIGEGVLIEVDPSTCK